MRKNHLQSNDTPRIFKQVNFGPLNVEERIFQAPLFLGWVCFICCLSLVLLSCATANVKNESPTRFGYGLNMSPGIQLGNSNSSAHLQLGYSRFEFQGGGGHNNFFQTGIQYRYAFSENAPEGFWAGAEASFLAISNKFSTGNTKQKASGFTIGGLAGYRFKIAKKVPVSFYIAPAYLNRGKFKTNGTISGVTGTGFYGRAGLDFHLFSLIYKKGR